ncbi:MAG: hypothetical protein JWP92_1800 [Caulobacter sp.]|nr:hypothetical protein [Caulobacter sp.]
MSTAPDPLSAVRPGPPPGYWAMSGQRRQARHLALSQASLTASRPRMIPSGSNGTGGRARSSANTCLRQAFGLKVTRGGYKSGVLHFRGQTPQRALSMPRASSFVAVTQVAAGIGSACIGADGLNAPSSLRIVRLHFCVPIGDTDSRALLSIRNASRRSPNAIAELRTDCSPDPFSLPNKLGRGSRYTRIIIYISACDEMPQSTRNRSNRRTRIFDGDPRRDKGCRRVWRAMGPSRRRRDDNPASGFHANTPGRPGGRLSTKDCGPRPRPAAG